MTVKGSSNLLSKIAQNIFDETHIEAHTDLGKIPLANNSYYLIFFLLPKLPTIPSWLMLIKYT
jgi:hypothetical protein